MIWLSLVSNALILKKRRRIKKEFTFVKVTILPSVTKSGFFLIQTVTLRYRLVDAAWEAALLSEVREFHILKKWQCI